MIPLTSLTDPNIHTQPFTAQTGPTIAPCAPASFGQLIVPGDDSLLLYAEGSADPAGKLYPGVLFCPGAHGGSQPRPMLPNTGNVALSFTFTMTAASIANGHVQETDAIFIIGGYKYNGSLQRHIATGQIDIGNWTNTGTMMGVITPEIEHQVEIQYAINVGNKTISVLSYTCDEVAGSIPSTLAQAAVLSNWLGTVDGSTGAVNLQFQIGLQQNGAPVTIKYSDISLRYW